MREPHPIRWKYDIFINGLDEHRAYNVAERPVVGSGNILFSSTKVDECKLWIEEKEIEAGYAYKESEKKLLEKIKNVEAENEMLREQATLLTESLLGDSVEKCSLTDEIENLKGGQIFYKRVPGK